MARREVMDPEAPRRPIVAGEPRTGGDYVSVRFPYDGSPVAEVALATPNEIDDALSSATAASRSFAVTAPFRRAALLERIADRIEEQSSELARGVMLESGQTINEATTEVGRAAHIFRIASAEAVRIHGEVVPLDDVPNGEGRIGDVRHYPIGPVLGITPFNAPLHLVAHKVAPALATGNPIIVRPSSKAPLSALRLGEICAAAGAPSGSISILPSAIIDADRLITDPRTKAITFTGSAEVGWSIKARAPEKRVTLELGGVGSVIVCSDADVSVAVDKCVRGGMARAGQSCASVQVIHVDRKIAASFEEQLVVRTMAIACGDPRLATTEMGSMVDEVAAHRATQLLEAATGRGAQLRCGGVRDGTMFEPTVIVDVAQDDPLRRQECFAPFLVVVEFDDVSTAIDEINSLDSGLQAAIFTHDLATVLTARDELRVGSLIVNDSNAWRVDSMPFGGVKKSGVGREGVRYAMQDLLEARLLVINRE